MSSYRYQVAGGLLVVVLIAVACSGGAGRSTPNPGSTAAHLSGSITVFAASSLTDAFKQLGQTFEAAHPGASVKFNFAASSALALQIDQGAPADVFASADEAQMSAVFDKGDVRSPRDFATNIPVVVIPKADPTVHAFSDLARPGVKLVLAAPAVPIGQYARQVLKNASGTAGISADFEEQALQNLQSNEANVRAVLAKIEVGEADAGIVYTTDAATATKDTATIAIPKQYNVVAHYPVAVVKDSGNVPLADAFVTYLLSPEGQTVLHKWGFGSPSKGGADGD